MKMYFQSQDSKKMYYEGNGFKCSVPLDLTNSLNAFETLERLKLIKGFEIL